MLDRLANESFGMYREALIWEMEKNGVGMLPKTKCIEIIDHSVKIENADGIKEIEANTVLFALRMKSNDYTVAALKIGASKESIAFIQE